MKITKAVYHLNKKELIVEATSSKGGVAKLNVVDFGLMNYHSKRDLYQLVKKGDNPSSVTVTSDMGGLDTAEVVVKAGKGKGK